MERRFVARGGVKELAPAVLGAPGGTPSPGVTRGGGGGRTAGVLPLGTPGLPAGSAAVASSALAFLCPS